MNQRLFITSTGTGVGKTFITAALVRQAMAGDKTVAAYKPVLSGYDPAENATCDAGVLLRALDQPVTPENIERISPWRFTAALAPTMAARKEKRPLEFDKLVEHSQLVMGGSENIVLIEGIGGVMVPLTERQTTLEWIEETDCNVILVTGNYLGALSHTLTALHVLIQQDIPIFAIVVCESEESTVPLADTVDELSRWTNLPIVPVARRKTKDGWMDIKELRPLVD